MKVQYFILCDRHGKSFKSPRLSLTHIYRQIDNVLEFYSSSKMAWRLSEYKYKDGKLISMHPHDAAHRGSHILNGYVLKNISEKELFLKML